MFCKGQLVQLQRDLPAIRRAGLELAAVSYDSPEVLHEFAERKQITYPLLSDHETELIRRLGLADRQFRKGNQLDIDTEVVHNYGLGLIPVYGVPYPSVLVLDTEGRVVWRFVSESATLRLTGNAILERSVGTIADESRSSQRAKRLKVTATASNGRIGLGTNVVLGVELDMPPGLHVYGPEVKGGYIGTAWKMDQSMCWDMTTAAYPDAKQMRFPFAGETLPVYQGTVRMTRSFAVRPLIKPADPSTFQVFQHECLDAASQVHVKGTLTLQACNARQCFPPETLPLEWKFEFAPPDRERAPVELRREFEQ